MYVCQSRLTIHGIVQAFEFGGMDCVPMGKLRMPLHMILDHCVVVVDGLPDIVL